MGNATDGSDSVQCHTDLSTCCNAAAGLHRGLGGQYQCTVSNSKPSHDIAELIIVTGITTLLYTIMYFPPNFNDLYIVQVLSPLMISLSPSTSSPLAGESLSLTCSVTLPGTVIGSPVFQWVGHGDTLTLLLPLPLVVR